jgi:hypothetical protein
MHDRPGYKDTVVAVCESEKRLKKEVQVNVIDGGGRALMPGLTLSNGWVFNHQ